MATKKQLKKYARNLEALLYLNSAPDQLQNLTIIASDNCCIEAKIELTVSRLMIDYQKDPQKSALLNQTRFTMKNKDVNF